MNIVFTWLIPAMVLLVSLFVLSTSTSAAESVPVGARSPLQSKNANESKDTSPAERAATNFLQRHDSNDDGKLSKSEVPRRFRDRFDLLDANDDGSLDKGEILAAFRVAMRESIPNAAKDTSTHYAGDGFLWGASDAPFTSTSTLLSTLRDGVRKKDVDVRLTFPKIREDQKTQDLPLIVFSHGAGGSRESFGLVHDYWSAHGYVTVSVTHADSVAKQGKGLRGAFEDLGSIDAWKNRVADLTFVIDSVAEIEKLLGEHQVTVDEGRVGVSGHSFGAFTTLQVAGAKASVKEDGEVVELDDKRPVAFLAFSPLGTGQEKRHLAKDAFDDIDRPLMTISGSKDKVLGKPRNTVRRKDAFNLSPAGGKYLTWIEGASHFSFSGEVLDGKGLGAAGANLAEERQFVTWSNAASLAFWDAHLKSNWKARGYLSSPALSIESKNNATIEQRLDKRDYPDEEALKRALAYSKAHGGEALLVMRDGEAILENYHNGYSANRAHLLASGTKSFWGVLAQIAIADGLLTLDEKASNTLTEWKDDERKSKISVRHLLELTSGLAPSQDLLQGPAKESKFKLALDVPCEHEPGAVYAYGPSHFFAFGELLRRKLQTLEKPTTLTKFLHSKLLDPIGLDVTLWRKDQNGEYYLPHGAFLTAREWIKFGELLRRGGALENRQVVSTEALYACFRGSKANPAYGLTFWLNADASSTSDLVTRAQQAANGGGIATRAPHDTVMAAGKGKQRLYVIPSLELSIVRFGKDSSPTFSDAGFLAALLSGSLVYSIRESETTKDTKPGKSKESEPQRKPAE